LRVGLAATSDATAAATGSFFWREVILDTGGEAIRRFCHPMLTSTSAASSKTLRRPTKRPRRRPASMGA
jgi:hypothetical protein